ncbi:hypothetical protein, partial [Opacimonas viscosa]
LASVTHVIGELNQNDTVTFTRNGDTVLSDSRVAYRTIWAETTYAMQTLRDNPSCAEQEHKAKQDAADPGLHAKLSYDINHDVAAPYIAKGI